MQLNKNFFKTVILCFVICGAVFSDIKLNNYATLTDFSYSLMDKDENLIALDFRIHNAEQYNKLIRELYDFSEKEKMTLIYEGTHFDKNGLETIDYYINNETLPQNTNFLNYKVSFYPFEEVISDKRYEIYGSVKVKFVTQFQFDQLQKKLIDSLNVDSYDLINELHIEKSELLERISNNKIEILLFIVMIIYISFLHNKLRINRYIISFTFNIVFLMVVGNLLSKIQFMNQFELNENVKESFTVHNLGDSSKDVIENLNLLQGFYYLELDEEDKKNLDLKFNKNIYACNHEYFKEISKKDAVYTYNGKKFYDRNGRMLNKNTIKDLDFLYYLINENTIDYFNLESAIYLPKYHEITFYKEKIESILQRESFKIIDEDKKINSQKVLFTYFIPLIFFEIIFSFCLLKFNFYYYKKNLNDFRLLEYIEYSFMVDLISLTILVYLFNSTAYLWINSILILMIILPIIIRRQHEKTF